MKDFIVRYNIALEENVYQLEDPSQKEVIDVMKKVTAKVREGNKAETKVNYTVLMLASAHGFIKDGMQQFIVNEFNPLPN